MWVDDFDYAFRRIAFRVARTGFNTGDNIHSTKALLFENIVLYFDLTGPAYCDRSRAQAQRQVKVHAAGRPLAHTASHHALKATPYSPS
jgi:hypothetical protein